MEWICFQNKKDTHAFVLVAKFSHRGTMEVIVATMARTLYTYPLFALFLAIS
jgi:hypothetical protein